MDVFDNQNDLIAAVAAAKKADKRIGFVPTMGALHDGHLSLVNMGRREADFVVVSIFVNPTQFAPDEDFEAYPRDTERDISILEGAKVDCAYLPSVDEIYPNGVASNLQAGEAAKGLESEFRPHFFDGVCSVVHRLFEIVQPDVAIFGKKDYQQLMVVREMVKAQRLDIEILGAPIVRDVHGLALSSRNAYLSDAELKVARRLNLILKHDRPTPNAILKAGFDKVDYIEERWGRRLCAAWIGKTRLIDNVPAS